MQRVVDILCYVYLRLTVLFNKAGSLHTDWDIARNIYIKYRLFILMNNLVLLLTTNYYMVSDVGYLGFGNRCRINYILITLHMLLHSLLGLIPTFC